MDGIEKNKVRDECVKLLELFRKMLIDENRLFCELRDRGAECISCNVSYVCGNQYFSKNLKGELECSSEGDEPQDSLELMSPKWNIKIPERDKLQMV